MNYLQAGQPVATQQAQKNVAYVASLTDCLKRLDDVKGQIEGAMNGAENIACSLAGSTPPEPKVGDIAGSAVYPPDGALAAFDRHLTEIVSMLHRIDEHHRRAWAAVN